jgi:hypothetical protein
MLARGRGAVAQKDRGLINKVLMRRGDRKKKVIVEVEVNEY